MPSAKMDPSELTSVAVTFTTREALSEPISCESISALAINRVSYVNSVDLDTAVWKDWMIYFSRFLCSSQFNCRLSIDGKVNVIASVKETLDDSELIAT